MNTHPFCGSLRSSQLSVIGLDFKLGFGGNREKAKDRTATEKLIDMARKGDSSDDENSESADDDDDDDDEEDEIEDDEGIVKEENEKVRSERQTNTVLTSLSHSRP